MNTATSHAVSVRLVKTGVYMGDHAQDVVVTVEVRPDETLHEAAERLLTQHGASQPDYEWRLEVQLVEPAPQRAVDPGPAGIGDFDDITPEDSRPF